MAEEECGLTSKREITCSECNYTIKVENLESLRCPRCFSILLTKCEDCQQCF
ncbi:MAG: hypothetical protein ACQEQI_07200 [Bacillota bacterium]